MLGLSMAGWRAHEAINLGVLGALGGAYALGVPAGWTEKLGLSPQAAVAFAISFLVGTFLVTPDLDLAESQVRAKSRWGLLGHLWVPYGRLFRHRGYSHSWLLGPLTRLIYLALLIGLIGGAAVAMLGSLGYVVRIRSHLGRHGLASALAGLLGFYLSQWLHLMADGVGPLHGLHRMRKR